MQDFQTYLAELANHEKQKMDNAYTNDPRAKILVAAGVHLNWLGDFFANPNITWELKTLPVEKIYLTGTRPDWNKILLEQCERSVPKFLQLIEEDSAMREKFEEESSNGEELVIVRHDEKEEGYYKVLDGMHRFVGALVKGVHEMDVFIPTNEFEHLPVCEPHVVYDLIRAFMRHADDEAGKDQLYQALTLLARTYENVVPLLKERFDKSHVFNQNAITVIEQVVADFSE